MPNNKTYVPKTIRVFISYSHKDRHLAGQIKSELQEYGLQVFLAHDDIAPTRVWQEAILKNLKRCDVFVPLLTRHFRTSLWVDQELGVAIALDKFIIPVKLDVDPYGFISQYQAMKFDPDHVRDSCRQIFKTIGKRDGFAEAIRDCVVRSFLNSDTFDHSKRRSGILEALAPYSREQLNEIVRGSMRNSQIHDGFVARRVVSRLINANRAKIDKRARKEFERVAANPL